MLTPLEKAVLDMMLDRPGEPYASLRQHLAHATVGRRESTGVGFAIHFTVPDDAPVRRDLPETALAILEGVTTTGDWPEDTHDFRVYRGDAA